MEVPTGQKCSSIVPRLAQHLLHGIRVVPGASRHLRWDIRGGANLRSTPHCCRRPAPAALKTRANRITFYTAITVEEFEVEKCKFGWAKIEISKYVSELMKAVYFYVHK